MRARAIRKVSVLAAGLVMALQFVHPPIAGADVVAPDAPYGVGAVAGDAVATVTWTPPLADGGSPVTRYIVSAVEDPTRSCTYNVPSSGETDSCVVTGLTDGSAYSFTVVADNGTEMSVPSYASSSVIPAGAPGAPTDLVASPGDTSATVTFTTPSANGSTITSYNVIPTDVTTSTALTAQSPTCTDNGDGTTSCVVAGLTNGDSYTFTVQAGNSYGYGSASDSSSAIGPSGVPGTPLNLLGVGADTSATVTFTTPSANGSTITSYNVIPTDLTTSTALTAQSPTCTDNGNGTTSCVVVGLTNGDSYTFTVQALNANGSGALSSATAPITPSDAPTGFSVTPGDGQITLSWTPSSTDSLISSYEVVATDARGTTLFGSPSSPTVTGLTNGASYQIGLSETFVDGSTILYSDVASATPAAPPVAPAVTPAAYQTQAGHQVNLTYTAISAANSGGSGISSYQVEATASGQSTIDETCNAPTGSTGTCIVTGLANGVLWNFAVTATNNQGIESSPTNVMLTPVGAPSTPSGISVVQVGRGDTSVLIHWVATLKSLPSGGVIPSTYWGGVAPMYAGSDSINWTFTGSANVVGGGAGPSCSAGWRANSCWISGLVPGNSYTLSIAASNGVLTSEVVTSPSVALSSVPGMPGSVKATPGPSSVTVRWSKPSTGGHAITNYQLTVGSKVKDCGTVTTCVMTGLSPGSTYDVSVAATNSPLNGSVIYGPSGSASPTTIPVPPNSPTNVSAVKGSLKHSIVVTWSAPLSSGTSPITNYIATSSSASATKTCAVSVHLNPSAPLQCTFKSLNGASTYTFRVTAQSASGTSAESTPTSGIKP